MRWATPLVFAVLWLCFTWVMLAPDGEQRRLLLEWAALSGGLASPEAWRASLQDGNSLRLASALFLLGGAVANLAAVAVIGTPDQLIIGASGAVSALIGAYLALFPGARLGLVLPLGLFLQFVKVPAALLIGVWALLQFVFTFIGPAYGAVAWSAHLAGFAFGGAFALLARAGIARRLRRSRGY